MPIYIRNPDVDHKNATGCQKCLNLCEIHDSCTGKRWIGLYVLGVSLLVITITLLALRYHNVI